MQTKPAASSQISFLMPSLGEQLDPRQPLKQLADRLPWLEFEQAFGKYYSPEGRPAKPVRLMVGLLLLKQMFNQGDETVVAGWVQNPYWQYFCGMTDFQWAVPCDPSDLVYFRQRIGEAGVQRILQVTVQLHGDKAQESEVVVDTTVQEKNITHPTDTKLAHKIIRRCWKLADGNGVKLRRRYRKAVRQCVMAQRWRKDPRKRKTAQRALRKMKVIAGRLIRELERKLPESVRAEQRGELCPVSAGIAPKARGQGQGVFAARAAGVLPEQGQGAQEIRVWEQGLGGDDQDAWLDCWGGGPRGESLRRRRVATGLGTNPGHH